MNTMWPRRVGAVLGAAACLALDACGSSSRSRELPAAAPSSAVPSWAPSDTPRLVAERQALDAYRGLLAAWVKASRAADPDEPDLRRYADKAALTGFVTFVLNDKIVGKYGRGELGTNPVVTSAEPSDNPVSVAVLDCLDTTNFLAYKASGELWDDKPGGRSEMTATVTKADGVWKVTAFHWRVYGTC